MVGLDVIAATSSVGVIFFDFSGFSTVVRGGCVTAGSGIGSHIRATFFSIKSTLSMMSRMIIPNAM